MIKLPEKNWFTFSELIQRWQCTELDVIHLLIEGKLVPSYHFSGDFDTFEMKTEGDGDDTHVYLDGVSGLTKSGEVDQVFEPVHGLRYLMQPTRVAATEGEFHFFSDSRQCDVGELCYHIPEPLSVFEVIKNGVVTAVEVAMFEEARGKGSQSDRPLLKRERDTLLTIIAALVKKSGHNTLTTGKIAGFISGLTDELGAHVSKRAVEDHLKEIPGALEVRKK